MRVAIGSQNVRTAPRFTSQCFQCVFLVSAFILGIAAVAPAQQPVRLPPVTVIGITNVGSLTSPSIEAAEQIKKKVPGGFTLQGLHSMNLGRVSSLHDLMQDAPGFVTLSENNAEVSKVFIRGSGVIQEDEPIGVQYLMDGLTLNQGDGEIILEDFDVGTVKYAEIYRGANALQYGGLGLGGAVNFVPFTGYDAAPLSVRLEGGSFGFVRSQVTSGGVDGAFDYIVSVSARAREGWRDHSDENTEMLFTDFGYRFTTNLENRFYVMVDQTRRQLPGAVSYQELEHDPTQTQFGATSEDFQKNWYYFRVADKLAYESGRKKPAWAGIGGIATLTNLTFTVRIRRTLRMRESTPFIPIISER
jgi:iron complex outermembrane recepter protein